VVEAEEAKANAILVLYIAAISPSRSVVIVPRQNYLDNNIIYQANTITSGDLAGVGLGGLIGPLLVLLNILGSALVGSK
jgi:hypothetical protein